MKKKTIYIIPFGDPELPVLSGCQTKKPMAYLRIGVGIVLMSAIDSFHAGNEEQYDFLFIPDEHWGNKNHFEVCKYYKYLIAEKFGDRVDCLFLFVNHAHLLELNVFIEELNCTLHQSIFDKTKKLNNGKFYIVDIRHNLQTGKISSKLHEYIPKRKKPAP
ncbi:MAG: hypothetical protein WC795_00270 [Candidatus Paceibacterota bacterium]|jgi:hypothetical protein